MDATTTLKNAVILGAPLNHASRNSTGIWGVNRQGCRFSRPAPWMARGGGPPNHWRITGTPSPGEVPSGGARAFCLLLRFSKVSRRQGGTLSGRYRRNGYVHCPTVLTVRPSSQASQLHTVWTVLDYCLPLSLLVARAMSSSAFLINESSPRASSEQVSRKSSISSWARRCRQHQNA